MCAAQLPVIPDKLYTIKSYSLQLQVSPLFAEFDLFFIHFLAKVSCCSTVSVFSKCTPTAEGCTRALKRRTPSSHRLGGDLNLQKLGLSAQHRPGRMESSEAGPVGL